MQYVHQLPSAGITPDERTREINFNIDIKGNLESCDVHSQQLVDQFLD